ncbi:MAG: antibiotic biosynthesis monooxygenase [Actinomycetota bacterium]|nr:antibiotic biosynthesis monooxygenase [Actinomycetota bacterium]
MTVIRVATYPIDSAKVDELRQSVDAELLPLYRKQLGFERLEIVDSGDNVVSISRWDSQEHAEAGSQAAIAWAKTAPGSLGPPSALHIGEIMNAG